MTHSTDTPATPEADDTISRALQRAYLAGFNAAGEGYNGEYPFSDYGRCPTSDEDWIIGRDMVIEKLSAVLPSPQNGEGELAGCKIALEQAWASCREHIARTEKAEAALAREEKAHEVTIGQRDRAEDMADKLAQAIGGDGIGEHSSGNCPWSNALEIAALTAQPVALTESQTSRGFQKVGFCDHYGVDCSIQKSSLATEHAIWIGADNLGLKRFPGNYTGWHDVDLGEVFPGQTISANNHMHLTQDDVRAILPTLTHFAETGDVLAHPATHEKGAES